jgi:hypothetical protein
MRERRYRHRAFTRTARVINGACGFLFVVFALHFLIVKQSDVLMLSYGMFNHSDTPFDLLKASVISTVCLVIPAQLLYYFVTLPLSVKALVWSPSYLSLGLLTSLIVQEGFFSWRTLEAVLLISILVFLFFFFRSRPDFHRHSRPRMMSLFVSNLLVVFLSILACWTLSNTSISLHYGLDTGRMVRDGRMDDVMSSPERMCCLTERLLRSDDMAGKALKVPYHLGRYLGYAPSDWSVPMSRFIRAAIAEEERRDTVNFEPSKRLYRLRVFEAALQSSSINNNTN